MTKNRVATAALTLAGTLAAAALLSGCGGPSKPAFLRPEPDAFRTGTCHDAAPALLAIGDIGQRLAGAKAVPEPDNKVLTAQQKKLMGLRTSAELSQPVHDLVVAIGFVRLRADSRTYDDPTLMVAMVDAQQKVVRDCVPS